MPVASARAATQGRALLVAAVRHANKNIGGAVMSVFSTRAGVLRLLIATCVMGFALLFGGKAQAGVEYVKVCSLYGAGFYYIPGTDTCIKLGGYLRIEHPVQAGTGFLCDN